ncbi:MAG: 5'/3'-nucleotidase SurE [candidate division Zixibacteria bacterium]|nr:5'/3'-nucleotidase SurE [candidate division Zixibacteria bacterium]
MLALLTNDDGYAAEGLRRLSREIGKLCDVLVVAPTVDQSAAAHSLTLQRPLRLKEIKENLYTVDGTPTDAVMVAMYGILDNRKPDILISGINRGPNMGDDITYSGTVAAAFEGAILGIPSIAVSTVEFEDIDYAAAARFTRKLARKVLNEGLPDFSLLNVNIPNPTNGKYAGVKITRLGKRVYHDILLENLDPRGKKYYWIGGEPEWEDYDNSDYSATKEGYVSITPLKMDMTDYDLGDRLRGWKFRGL